MNMEEKVVFLYDGSDFPTLPWNIEGLGSHVFAQERTERDARSALERNATMWLVNCLIKAARSYEAARRCALAPKVIAREKLSALIDFSFDFAFHMEDCIESLERATSCSEMLATRFAHFSLVSDTFSEDRKSLEALHREQVRIHQRLLEGHAGELGSVLSLSDDGTKINLSQLVVSILSIYSVFLDVFHGLCLVYDDFDFTSSPAPAACTHIPVTVA